MITDDQQTYILSKAYVPEHIVSLIMLISKAEPFLLSGCLCYVKGEWLIVIGYPLEGEFDPDHFRSLVEQATAQFNPQSIWMAAPEIPDDYLKSSDEAEHDVYYRFDLDGFNPKRRLMREVNRAMEQLTIERTSNFTKEHGRVVEEFIRKDNPPVRIKELYLSIPHYVAESKTAMLLDARDKKGRLSAFYVVDCAPQQFAAYVVGCHSKKNYVSHASDALFYEMVRVAGEFGKSYINLGLGVNDGIRGFKEKWGGTPYLKYTFCAYRTGRKNIPNLIGSMVSAMKRL